MAQVAAEKSTILDWLTHVDDGLNLLPQFCVVFPACCKGKVVDVHDQQCLLAWMPKHGWPVVDWFPSKRLEHPIPT